MSGFQRAAQRGRLCFIPCFSVLLLLLFSQALKHRWQENWHKRRILDSTEMPAEHIDPAAIDLTPLVNALINSSHSGSRQLFSLLSVTSYSSLALHKLTLLVYNISSIKNVESNMFRRRFCYCVTNETNDLTDFTAILLDVVGNSTSSLHELFKSSSILSVSQRNNSDCIYICVMAGKMSREVPELWEFSSIPPLFNQTVIEGPHRGNVSSFRLPVEWHQLPTNLSHVSPSGTSSLLTSRVQSTADESPSVLHETSPTATVASSRPLATARQPTPVAPQSQPAAETTALQPFPTRSRPASAVTTARAAAPLSTVSSRPATLPPVSLTRLATEAQLTPHVTSAHPTTHLTVAQRTTGAVSQRTTIPSRPEETEKPGCPWRRPELSRDGGSTSTTTVSAHKLQPCVLELCKFFSQCLCRPSTHRTRMKRYCDDSHLWYEKHTSEVCRRVRRISFSRNLKQRCLTKMCSKL